MHCSLAAIRELRAQNPAAFPPTPHTWATVQDHTAPLVCYVCTEPVFGAEWQVGVTHKVRQWGTKEIREALTCMGSWEGQG